MAIFNVIHWEVLDINPGGRLTIEINAAEQFDVRWYYLIAHAPGVGWTKRVGDRVTWIPEVVPGLDRIAALDLVPPMEEINILAQRTTSCDECLDFTGDLLRQVALDIKCNHLPIAMRVENNVAYVFTIAEKHE